ncbi:hypothetical protein [Helicobacter pylori]|uniref:hypothetical protein n=1 Tax=Helicobacter pylori TaxID=210 RepID=UPI003565D9E6
MVVGSEEMENADNGCFMPIISSEKDSEIFFSNNDNNELSIHIGCECVNVDFIPKNFINDNTKYYNRK